MISYFNDLTFFLRFYRCKRDQSKVLPCEDAIVDVEGWRGIRLPRVGIWLVSNIQIGGTYKNRNRASQVGESGGASRVKTGRRWRSHRPLGLVWRAAQRLVSVPYSVLSSPHQNMKRRAKNWSWRRLVRNPGVGFERILEHGVVWDYKCCEWENVKKWWTLEKGMYLGWDRKRSWSDSVRFGFRRVSRKEERRIKGDRKTRRERERSRAKKSRWKERSRRRRRLKSLSTTRTRLLRRPRRRRQRLVTSAASSLRHPRHVSLHLPLCHLWHPRLGRSLGSSSCDLLLACVGESVWPLTIRWILDLLGDEQGCTANFRLVPDVEQELQGRGADSELSERGCRCSFFVGLS